jgi:sulfur-carrier protein
MKIKINAYSSARTACGFSERHIEAESGASIGSVMERLYKDHEKLASMKEKLLFAVNEQYCDISEILKEGDVLSIFPPVSGG